METSCFVKRTDGRTRQFGWIGGYGVICYVERFEGFLRGWVEQLHSITGRIILSGGSELVSFSTFATTKMAHSFRFGRFVTSMVFRTGPVSESVMLPLESLNGRQRLRKFSKISAIRTTEPGSHVVSFTGDVGYLNPPLACYIGVWSRPSSPELLISPNVLKLKLFVASIRENHYLQSGDGFFSSIANSLSNFGSAMSKSVNDLLAYEGLEVVNPEGGTEDVGEEARRGRWNENA
ncbi:hypothetical protein F3Y22_tig00110839pilonHSYRG00034 [Hibiscus syriacus]|uniref:Uncharacterized protein n=1 Tax=Hibiscus syriacus TaxID=106335 RepID=A0A6A2ZLN7_HIBSY|nr:hypothetical protein F3Y22_tig00110839pilonHSYRG00034 [Hibiscus syriacus]